MKSSKAFRIIRERPSLRGSLSKRLEILAESQRKRFSELAFWARAPVLGVVTCRCQVAIAAARSRGHLTDEETWPVCSLNSVQCLRNFIYKHPSPPKECQPWWVATQFCPVATAEFRGRGSAVWGFGVQRGHHPHGGIQPAKRRPPVLARAAPAPGRRPWLPLCARRSAPETPSPARSCHGPGRPIS